MRVVSRVRRACFIAAALLVATAAVAPVVAKAAGDPDANRPIAWSGSVNASGLHATADRTQQLLPLQHPFFGNFPDAAGIQTWLVSRTP